MAGPKYDQGGSNGKRRGWKGVGQEKGGCTAGGKVVMLSRGALCF